MTLKKDIFGLIIINKTFYNDSMDELSIVLEKKVDEFAIDFADWYLDLWLNDNNSSFDNNSPKKLLEIFKKEKGY